MNPANSLRVIHRTQKKILEFKEKVGTEFVSYGERNNYPDYLLNLFTHSVTHNAVVNGKCHYIIGKGWQVETEEATRVLIENKIKRVNAHGESLDQVSRKLCLDKTIFGGMAIEVNYNKMGERNIYHVDFSKVRCNEEMTLFFYSPDWSKIKTDTKANREKGFKTWGAYDPSKRSGSQLLYITAYRPDQKTYPLPEYLGAIYSIETEIALSKFNYNRVKNNFLGGWSFNFLNGLPSQEEQEQIENKIHDKFTGESADMILLNFANGEKNLVIDSLTPPDLNSQFEQLEKKAQKDIFIGHRIVSPSLFAVETDSGFGNRTEIIEKMEVLQSTYVDFHQSELEMIINELFETGDALKIQRVQPVKEQFSENVVSGVMTNDEIRETIGLEPLQKMSVTHHSSEDNKLIEALSSCGTPESKVKVLYRKPLKYDKDSGLPLIDEKAFRQEFALDIEVLSLDKEILSILKDSSTTTLSEISKALDVPLTEVVETVKKLADAGGLEISNTEDIEGGIRVERVLSSDELDEITNDPPNEEITVMYRYVTRDDVPDAISGSRDFCRRLLQLGRLYSKSDIDQISASLGIDVWKRRGGFYHNPKTNVTTPYCRHLWEQQLVRISNE